MFCDGFRTSFFVFCELLVTSYLKNLRDCQVWSFFCFSFSRVFGAGKTWNTIPLALLIQASSGLLLVANPSYKVFLAMALGFCRFL